MSSSAAITFFPAARRIACHIAVCGPNAAEKDAEASIALNGTLIPIVQNPGQRVGAGIERLVGQPSISCAKHHGACAEQDRGPLHAVSQLPVNLATPLRNFSLARLPKIARPKSRQVMSGLGPFTIVLPNHQHLMQQRGFWL